MLNREEPDFIRLNPENEDEWKASHHVAAAPICDFRPAVRCLRDHFNRSVEFRHERLRRDRTTFRIPQPGFTRLEYRQRMSPDLPHRQRARKISRRATAHGTGFTLPESSSCSRRVI